jgi:hypothetical protein
MTTIELAKRVQAMRKAQQVYFASRQGKDIDESRRQERELDKLVDEIIRDRPAKLPGFDADEGTKAFEAGGQEWADWNMAKNPFGD